MKVMISSSVSLTGEARFRLPELPGQIGWAEEAADIGIDGTALGFRWVRECQQEQGRSLSGTSRGSPWLMHFAGNGVARSQTSPQGPCLLWHRYTDRSAGGEAPVAGVLVQSYLDRSLRSGPKSDMKGWRRHGR